MKNFKFLYFKDFGLKIEETQTNIRNKLLTPFDFEPFIIGFLPNNYWINYKPSLPLEIEEEKDMENSYKDEEKLEKTSYLKKKRNIIISDPNVIPLNNSLYLDI